MTSTFLLKIETAADGALSASMMIDGKPFGEDWVGLSNLLKSAIISGAYDLQTCGCGTPECAGFWEPIFVQHQGDIVRWEFDSRYHPIPKRDKNESSERSVIRYEFDRMQYITEIREKIEWLKIQPNRDSLGPYGFDASTLDEVFPDPSLPQLPFPDGAIIVVGYTSEYHQPWIWVDGYSDIYPRQLLPTGAMWASFGRWSLMWDSQHFDLGECVYREDSTDFALRSDVSADECNYEVEQLVHSLNQYWGAPATIVWDRIDEVSRSTVLRCEAGSPSELPR
jgi:hypothetical protein